MVSARGRALTMMARRDSALAEELPWLTWLPERKGAGPETVGRPR
ncbi:hypothetical protein ACFOY2_30655 [Nonomuraea purpurea]|uniref:Uncharacterized protein n=1 Tax=Nonomuraea purpurea TaxID=1849276 RepID=A0ABV8GCA4_9ACTN